MVSTSLSEALRLSVPPMAVSDPDAARRARERVEAEHAVLMLRGAMDRSGIPAAYRGAPFEGEAVEIVARFDRGDGSYVFGDQGRGKTWAACAAGMELLRRGRTVRFVDAETILAEADEARREPSWDRAGSYARPDLLIVDDVDKLLRAKDYGAGQLFTVADARQGRPTVYTANLGYRLLASGLEAVAGKSVAGPIMSRIQGACGPAIEMKGSDRRTERWR